MNFTQVDYSNIGVKTLNDVCPSISEIYNQWMLSYTVLFSIMLFALVITFILWHRKYIKLEKEYLKLLNGYNNESDNSTK